MKNFRLQLARVLLDGKPRQPCPLAKISKVLFLRDDDKFGDMVVSTISFRELKKAGFHVFVVSGQSNREVILHNNNIEKIFVFRPGLRHIIKLALQLRKEEFDLIIDIGDELTPAYLLFIKLINAKNVLGFNKNQYSRYNLNVDYKNKNSHISKRHLALLKSLGVPDICLDYDLCVPSASEDLVLEYLAHFRGERIVVLNPYTAIPQKDMSIQQLSGLVSLIKENFSSIKIIIVGIPNRINQLDLPGVERFPFKHFTDVISLVKNANLVISPDTSLVHIASAYKKMTVSLYRRDKPGGFSSQEWGPNNENAVQLFTRKEFAEVRSIATAEIFDAAKTCLNKIA